MWVTIKNKCIGVLTNIVQIIGQIINLVIVFLGRHFLNLVATFRYEFSSLLCILVELTLQFQLLFVVDISYAELHIPFTYAFIMLSILAEITLLTIPLVSSPKIRHFGNWTNGVLRKVFIYYFFINYQNADVYYPNIDNKIHEIW